MSPVLSERPAGLEIPAVPAPADRRARPAQTEMRALRAQRGRPVVAEYGRRRSEYVASTIRKFEKERSRTNYDNQLKIKVFKLDELTDRTPFG